MASPSVTTVTRRVPGNVSTAIQQQITSGGNFDGTLPQAAGPVRADSPLQPGNSTYKYAAAAKGGLFFWNVNESLVVTQILVDLGANADLSVYIANLTPGAINDDSPTIIAGERFLIGALTAGRIFAADRMYVLLPYQAIQVVSTASAAAQIASVSACLERTMQR